MSEKATTGKFMHSTFYRQDGEIYYSTGKLTYTSSKYAHLFGSIMGATGSEVITSIFLHVQVTLVAEKHMQRRIAALED